MNIPLTESDQADTISGLLTDHRQQILSQGEKIDLQGAVAEIMEVKNETATKVKFVIKASD